METTAPKPASSDNTPNYPPDIWQAAVMAMPWFYPPRRRKRLRVEWHARFVPPSAKALVSAQAYLKFRDIEHLIEMRRLEVRQKALDLYSSRRRKVHKIARAAMQMGKSPEEDKRARVTIKRMRYSGPEEKEAVFNEVKDFLEGKRTQSSSPPPDASPPRTLARLNREGDLLERTDEVDDFITKLVKLTLNGDTAAASALKGIAAYATTQLSAIVHAKPELFRRIAATSSLWPVVASINPHWIRGAERLLDSIKLGSETLHAKVKPVLAFDRNVPARRWAKDAIEVLEINRQRFGDPRAPEPSLMFLKCDHHVHLCPIPHWARAAGQLPPLSRQSAKAWATLSREMIRAEVPRLEEHTDWKSVAGRFEHLNGKAGVVRNKVLDAIGSALCSLVKEGLPKNESSNSATQKR